MTNDPNHTMFADVLLGFPRYFYTAEPGNPVVNIHQIVRDGSNRLWMSTKYGGVLVEETSVKVLDPVPLYSNLEDEQEASNVEVARLSNPADHGPCPHDGATALVHRAYHNQIVTNRPRCCEKDVVMP